MAHANEREQRKSGGGQRNAYGDAQAAGSGRVVERMSSVSGAGESGGSRWGGTTGLEVPGGDVVPRVCGVPRLAVWHDVRGTEEGQNEAQHLLRYRARDHHELPHVMKFSGGRSSGMLLFTLLENGLLSAERGDVVVFNNTSCEHPETYRFAARCQEIVERRYGVPFFWVEFQTYEDARRGEWSRIQSYRLVNSRLASEANPHGFHWRGEVFEELLSHAAYVPNQFRRICTSNLKLEATRLFLKDWFASKESIPQLGHSRGHSRVDLDGMYRRHLSSRGAVPREIFLRKKEYLLKQSPCRPQQRFRDFSSAAEPFTNPTLEGKVFGDSAWFGPGGIEYSAFIGLRGDEQLRVAKVEARRSNAHENPGYEGEHVYMPFSEMNVSKEDVNEFWGRQSWGLQLPDDGGLSNCVYCFLKGVGNLEQVRNTMERRKHTDVPGFGSMVDTPCDVAWWTAMEQKYGRDLEAEGRVRTGADSSSFVGFFGASSGLSYQLLANGRREGADLSRFASSVLPCDCTD